MTEELRVLLIRLIAGVFVAAGLLALVVGYLGVRDRADVVLQMPYLISGGLGGLGLILTGAVMLLQAQMREQVRRAADVVDSLEEWKEAALVELRGVVENATIEVQVSSPPTFTSAPNGANGHEPQVTARG